jgi:hypothetical protein
LGNPFEDMALGLRFFLSFGTLLLEVMPASLPLNTQADGSLTLA